MKCNNCGYEYREGDAFCPNCGTPTGAGYANGGRGNPNESSNSYNYNDNYNNGYNSNGYYNGPKAPIRKKDLPITIILSIVTCGIYGIVWFIQIVDDLNTAADRPDDLSGGMVFLLTLLTCGVFGLYWSYTAGEKVNYIRHKYGMATDNNLGLLYLILDFFKLNIVTYCLIQSELNKVARD